MPGRAAHATRHAAKRFGKEGFRAVLMARGGESLRRYQQEFADEGIEAYAHEADAGRTETSGTAFAWVKGRSGTLDVLVYNVGITAADEPDKMTAEELMRHYQTDVASAWHCARLVSDDDFGNKRGAILLTGGGLATHPLASFTPLSLDKAALRALACLLHDELKPKGIYVGTVTVCGTIGIGALFDTAEMYSYFKNEEFVGKALKGLPRDGVVISDKYWPQPLPGQAMPEGKLSEAGIRLTDEEYAALDEIEVHGDRDGKDIAKLGTVPGNVDR